MTLNRKRWLVRWFFWSLGIVDEFTEENRAWKIEERGTNLCFFFQTIFVFAPLVLLLHLAVIGGVLAVLFALPIIWFGFGHYSLTVLLLAAIIASVTGVIWYRDWRKEQRGDTPIRRAPSTAALVGQWIMAKKRHICPMISFSQQESRS